MNTTEHITSIIGLLNDGAEYAVLRNFEGLPDDNTARDIDIIITRRSFRSVKQKLVDLIDRSGWQIVTYLHSDRLITYVCAHLSSDPAVLDTQLVQWDFFFDTSVFGIQLMSADEFLRHKAFNGFLYHVDVECQFLDKYLYDRAVGAPYPEKYAATRAAAEHSEAVVDQLRRTFGTPSAAVCDRTGKGRLLIHAMGYNLRRRPLLLIVDMCRFIGTFVGNYLRSRTGFSMGFTGPDGSGKTTVIDMVIDQLGDVFAQAHAYYHFRPMLFGNLGEVAHSAGVKREVDRDYDRPHRGGRTSTLSSLVRLLYYSVDYIVGYWLRVKTKIRITRIVIFDRYYTDIICDSRRSRIYLPLRFLYGWGRLFIPSLDYNILLTADADTILARKRELDADGISDINRKIDFLASRPGYYRVVNDGTPAEAVNQILRVIFDAQHRKNLRRIG